MVKANTGDGVSENAQCLVKDCGVYWGGAVWLARVRAKLALGFFREFSGWGVDFPMFSPRSGFSDGGSAAQLAHSAT